MSWVDFSIPTFVDGAGLMIRTDGPRDPRAMAGQKTGVLSGTAIETELRHLLQKAGITADVVSDKTHGEGPALLDDGEITAYFADKSILESMIKDSKASDNLIVARTI